MITLPLQSAVPVSAPNATVQARPLPWRKHSRDIKLIPAVGALNRPDYSRLIDLLDMASASSPRWEIRESDETIRKMLDFGSVRKWFEFAAYLIENELFYCLENGALFPSVRLCPDEDEYPRFADLDASIANLKMRSADVGGEPDFFKAITPANKRQIVRRAFVQWLEDLRRAGLPVPPDEQTDRREYKRAHLAFKAAFVPLLLETGARALPPERIAGLWQPLAEDEENGAQASAYLPNLVTLLHPEKRDTESHVTPDESPIVTNFLASRVSQTADSDLVPPSASHQEEPKRDSNNSFSERDNFEERDNANVTPQNVTIPKRDKKAVVAFLCEEGVRIDDKITATISRDVAEILAKLPNIEEIAQRQAAYLPFRKLDKGGTWGGLWRKSIENDWAPPDAYNVHVWEEKERSARETKRREQEAQRQREAEHAAQIAAQEAEVDAHIQEHWAGLDLAEHVRVREEAANRLIGESRKRYQECLAANRAYPLRLIEELDRKLDEVLREMLHIPPREDKFAIAPSRWQGHLSALVMEEAQKREGQDHGEGEAGSAESAANRAANS